MYLVSVDFSKNNLLTEQLNVRSFYDLPILNSTLKELQFKNFADLTVKKAYVTEAEINDTFPLFEIVSAGLSELYRDLFSSTENEKIFLFRNDVYFECDFSSVFTFFDENEIIGLRDHNDFCFGVLCSLKSLKKIYNKNIGFFELLNNCRKYVKSYINADGYTQKLNNVKSYKCLLFDILNGKTLFKPPRIAEGIFTNGNVPKGDFSITPPVYIEESVQIENGSSIGPNTVVYKNTLISTNTSVKNSVLFENVYVSSECFIDGAVCCENSSVKRNSAVFAGSVIGANSLIGEDMTVENDSLIKMNVKYDKFLKSPFTNRINDLLKNKFQGLSPDKAALLGSSVAVVFKKPKILIGSDGESNSLSVKLAFLSGLISSGAECFDIGTTFKSHIFFSSAFCECDYSVFISGKGMGTNIEIFNSQNRAVSKADCYNLFDYCNKGEFVFVKPFECKKVRQIYGLRRMYIREITALFEEKLDFVPTVSCKNDVLLKTLEEILKQNTKNINTNHKMHINLNDTGTSAVIKYKNKIYSEKDLKRLVFFYQKTNKNKRFFDSGGYEYLWKVDSVFLIFTVLDIIKETGKNIDALICDLPNFYINSRSINTPLKTGATAEKLSVFQNVDCREGSYNIKFKKGLVKVVKNPRSEETKILCASENMAASAELCEFLSRYLEDI